MTKFLTTVSVSAFLVFSGISALAGQSERSDRMQSNDPPSMQQEKGTRSSSIESQSPSGTSEESAHQKGARPGVAGEEGETSMFGSPSTLPPGEHSPGYTGADKEAEQREQRQQGM